MATHEPVFIVSVARSGSTLLRLICDSHPQIWAPPELHLLNLCQKLLWVHGVLDDDGRRDDQFWDLAAAKTRVQVNDLLQPHLEKSGKTLWCEKSVTSVNHLDVLEGVFGQARCLFLYRGMADMVASGLRATAQRADGFDFEPWFLAWPHSRCEALARYWLDKSQAMLKAEQSLCFTHRLRYEDLVGHSERVVRDIAAFLDLPAPADWLSRVYSEPHQTGPGDDLAYRRTAIDASSVGGGADLPLAELPRRLVRQINDCSKQLDLPTIPA